MSKNSKPIWPHWPCYVTLNFDRLTHMKCMLGVNLNKFPQGVSEISCSQKCNVIWPHWPWPWLITYGHQNLISLSLSPRGCCSRSDEILSRGSLKYYIHKNGAASQHIDLDLWPWPLTYDHQNLVSASLSWMFVTNLKKFPQGIFEMLRSQESDRRTTWKHDAFWHNFCRCRTWKKAWLCWTWLCRLTELMAECWIRHMWLKLLCDYVLRLNIQ